MDLHDIIAILGTSNTQARGYGDSNSVVDWSDADSSDAYYGDVNEQFLDDMSDVLAAINGESRSSGIEESPSKQTDVKPVLEEVKTSPNTCESSPAKPKLQLPGKEAV